MRHYGAPAFNQPTPPVGRHVPDVLDGFDGQIEESKEQQAHLVHKPKHQNIKLPFPLCVHRALTWPVPNRRPARLRGGKRPESNSPPKQLAGVHRVPAG